MQRWTMKVYLERELARWKSENDDKPMPISVNGVMFWLDEVHVDFLLGSHNNPDDYGLLWGTSMVPLEGAQIRMDKSLIGAAEKR